MKRFRHHMVLITAGLFLVTVMMTALWMYSVRALSRIGGQNNWTREYERHYVMVSEDHSDQWTSIYEYARAAAEEADAYLEWAGADSPAELDAADCLRIAVASRADGIILHDEGQEDLAPLMQAASDAGIPVIKVLGEDNAPDRVSFIGLNSVQMGELYGQQVLRCLHEGTNRVMVLLGSSGSDTRASLLYAQMLQTVEQEKPESARAEFYTYDVNTATSFDAEEDIRNIFFRREQIPDILICLDLVSTECAMQALVDYNEVGNVSVIGYYASEAILDGIEKGLIRATLRIDSEEIGRLCIDALNEYRLLGHVSNFFNVGLEMITPENVNEYYHEQ